MLVGDLYTNWSSRDDEMSRKDSCWNNKITDYSCIEDIDDKKNKNKNNKNKNNNFSRGNNNKNIITYSSNYQRRYIAPKTSEQRAEENMRRASEYSKLSSDEWYKRSEANMRP